MNITEEQFAEFEERGQYEEEEVEEEKLQRIADNNHRELEDIVMRDNPFIKAIINEDYRKIEVLKDKEDKFYIYGTMRIDAKQSTFIYLQKRYPNAEIKAINYEGVIQYYEVVEKIRLEK